MITTGPTRSCAGSKAPSAGLLAEAIDGRTGGQLGNTPLLFSQVEYAKAAMAQAGVNLDPGPRRRR